MRRNFWHGNLRGPMAWPLAGWLLLSLPVAGQDNPDRTLRHQLQEQRAEGVGEGNRLSPSSADIQATPAPESPGEDAGFRAALHPSGSSPEGRERIRFLAVPGNGHSLRICPEVTPSGEVSVLIQDMFGHVHYQGLHPAADQIVIHFTDPLQALRPGDYAVLLTFGRHILRERLLIH